MIDTVWQQTYERNLVPAIFGPWSIITVNLAAPQPGQQVLDVACGTGVVARLAAQYVGPQGHVIGLDPNQGMLEVARSHSRVSDQHITWKEGDAQALPFPDATFDTVFCQGGLQFIPDRLKALREMHRVLKPEAFLAALVFQDIKYCPGFAALADSVSRFVSPQVAEFVRTPFVLSNEEVICSLLTLAGFSTFAIKSAEKFIHFPSIGGFIRSLLSGSPVNSILNETILSRLTEHAKNALEAYVQNEELVFPMKAHLISANA